MSEVESNLSCDNCNMTWRILYDDNGYFFGPEICPFCGESDVKDEMDQGVYEEETDIEEDDDDNRN